MDSETITTISVQIPAQLRSRIEREQERRVKASGGCRTSLGEVIRRLMIDRLDEIEWTAQTEAD